MSWYTEWNINIVYCHIFKWQQRCYCNKDCRWLQIMRPEWINDNKVGNIISTMSYRNKMPWCQWASMLDKPFQIPFVLILLYQCHCLTTTLSIPSPSLKTINVKKRKIKKGSISCGGTPIYTATITSQHLISRGNRIICLCGRNTAPSVVLYLQRRRCQKLSRSKHICDTLGRAVTRLPKT
jgi:hypothetical protein